MNKSAFLELIQQASGISDQQTEELEKVAATFPYCQTAHLLLAKSAYDKGSMLSTQRLRRASAYATNRQVLKHIIYTSPAPAPVFDAPIEEEQAVTIATAELSAERGIESAVATLHQDLPDDHTVVEEPEPIANEWEEVPEEALVSEEVVAYNAPTTEEAEETEAPLLESLSHSPAVEETEAETTESEEVIPFELAQLLTINSLNATFTDLLAQKPDTEAPDTGVTAEPSQHVTFPENFKEADAALAQLIAEESAVSAQAVYVLNENALPSPAVPEAAPSAAEEDEAKSFIKEEETPAVTAPEDAPVNYAFSEIDQMYADDALGYWMASSRTGEVLQLKDEVTRQRPAAFHPELILEYLKTHELEEKPEELKLPSLHQQLNIIDQFLRQNPRLKGMNHIKMKQEPQEDLSLRNSKIKKGIASESLANIFLKQGKVKKAIKIYEQLILKSPEKKSYFAEQIEKLQNLE